MDAGADLALVSVHKMGTGFEQGSVYHLQGDLIDPIRLTQCADLLTTTSANVMIYAGIDAWRRQMVQHGKELLGKALDLTRRVRSDIEQIAGFHVLEKELLGAEASREYDPMHVIIDVTNSGISGYQAADWLREHPKLDMGLSDSKRIEATISMVDDDETAARLLDGLHALAKAAPEMPGPPSVQLPGPGDLDAETAMLPRDAFFGPVEVVPVAEAAGRISAELITPYPPGIPAIFPGERINAAVLDYLTSGVAAGMVLPDPGDASLQTVRVVR